MAILSANSPLCFPLAAALAGLSNFVQMSSAAAQGSVSVDALANYIVGKDFTKARDWVFENATLNPTEVQRELYNALDDKLVGDQKAVAVMVFAEYAKNMATGADPLITLVALCTSLMSECKFK